MRLSGVLLAIAMSANSVSVALAAPDACRFTPQESRGATSDALQRLVSKADIASEQRGLGGTGLIAQSQERGLGGTGIVGVVTGFASVCVNGYEVMIDRKTEVTVEGLQGKRADVQLGQLVEVEAYPERDRLVAARIAVRVAVAGPVETIAADRRTVTIAGQTVEVAAFGPSTGVARLIRGDWVAVSGIRRADGTILGSSITRLRGRGQRVLVAGELQAGPDGKPRLGGLVVDEQGLQVGQRVVLRGDIDARVLIPRETRLELTSPFSASVQILSIQADATRVESELSRLSGVPVRLNDDLIRAAARNGVPVQADGRVQGKTFTPESIISPPRPVDVTTPARALSAPLSTPPLTPQSAPENSKRTPVLPARPPIDPRDGGRLDRLGERPTSPPRVDMSLQPVRPPDIPPRH